MLPETEGNHVASLLPSVEINEESDDGLDNPEALNNEDGLYQNHKVLGDSIAGDIEEDDTNANDDSDVQGMAESNFRTSIPLLPDTHGSSIRIDVEEDVNGSSNIRASNLERVERIFLIMNLMIEISTAVFDQLSSVHTPKFALISMLMSFTVLLISFTVLVYKGIKEKVKWMRRGIIPWFYCTFPTQKPFGAFPDIIGVVCAFFQSISTTIAYGFLSRHANNPIKISAWPVIFAGGVLWCGFRGRSSSGRPWIESRVSRDELEMGRDLEPLDHRGNRRNGAAMEHLEMLSLLEKVKMLNNLGKYNLLEMLSANEILSGNLEGFKSGVDEPLENEGLSLMSSKPDGEETL